MKPTAVYLLYNSGTDGDYKIGLSSSTLRRQRQVRDHYETQPVVVCSAWFPTRKAAALAEKLWHQYFIEHRCQTYSGREWFTLTEADINLFKQWTEASPTGTDLRLAFQSGRLTEYQAECITTRLLRSIPNGRTTIYRSRPT